MKRTITTFLVMFILLLNGGMTIMAQTASAPSGTGNSNDPYLIATLDNLYWITQNPASWTGYFKQIENIDATGTTAWDNGNGFSPIGNTTTNFKGNYNGQGFTINNLFINRVATDNIGIFGYANSATITNIGLTNVNITGRGYVGALIGQSATLTISYCYSTGTMNGGIDGSNNGVIGGLIGNSSSGSVQYCYSSCNVTGKKRVGGFIGNFMNLNINCCYATGSVSLNGTLNNTYAGGFGGDCEASIVGFVMKNCYAAGSVTNSSTGGLAYAGGFAGFIGGSVVVITTQNSYCTGAVSAVNTPKGFVARTMGSPVNINCFFDNQTTNQTIAGNTAITGLSTAEMKTYSTFINAGWDFKGESANGTVEIWNFENGRNNDYPYLSWQAPVTPLTVTTTAATLINSTSAILGGKIADINGASVTERGVVYSSTDATPMNGETDVIKDINGSGTGSFDKLITGLTPNIINYVRAYAINAGETIYGNIVSFTPTNTTSTAKVASSKIALYPTPASTSFYVTGVEKGELTIYDLNGRQVLASKALANTPVLINSLTQGVYTVKIISAEGIVEKKLIKE